MATLRHKLGMAPAFHDRAVIHYQDFIGIDDDRQTVCDDECRAVLCNRRERALDFAFGIRVGREGNALLLADREFQPASTG
jgi:hypothetical protein